MASTRKQVAAKKDSSLCRVHGGNHRYQFQQITSGISSARMVQACECGHLKVTDIDDVK